MMGHDRCGNCQAFKLAGCGNMCSYRKFRARLGYCTWNIIRGKMMSVYENNVPCGRFCPRKLSVESFIKPNGVMVAIGK